MAEFDSVIPAGGSGKLVTKVHTRQSQQGKIVKSVSVTTDAPGSEHIKLLVSFEVVAAIRITPNPSIYIATTEGRPSRSRVLLRRLDSQPLEITKIDGVLPKLFEVHVDPVEPGESPSRRSLVGRSRERS